MKLRSKTVIVLSVTVVTLMAILLGTSRIILSNSFKELEERNTRENVERMQSALSNDISDLDAFLGDWAAWDDTYAFIEDVNQKYIESNLVEGTFINSKLNLMVFINSSGHIVFAKAFDLQNEVEVSVSQSFLELLSVDDTIWRHNDTSSYVDGFVLLSEGPMLIASQPILTSQDMGPIRGALIMGRYFNSQEVTYLSERIHLPIIVRRTDDAQLPSDFQMALSHLSDEKPILVQPFDTEIVAGYTLIKDVHGEPCLLLRVDIPRDIYKQGEASFSYLVLSLVAVGLVFGVVSVILLDKLMLFPLAKLNSSVKRISKSGNLSMRVSKGKGKDELSDLSGEINNMLSALEKYQSEVKHYSEHLEELVEERTRKLKETQEKLLKSEKLATLGELSAMIGHDLRNPLTGIANATYYLKMKLGQETDTKTREMLELIQTDIEYSNKIINDLLEFSKEIQLDLSETTPKIIMTEALSLVEIPQNIQVIDAIQSNLKIKVDIDKMKRAFVNMIQNAIDAMPKGGKLVVRSMKANSNIEIIFTDTGAGMSKETLSKLWTPLFTTKARGMGLGLPICQRIVKAHGGKISVKSTVGKGTTFTITIPLAPKVEEGEEIYAAQPESWLSTEAQRKS